MYQLFTDLLLVAHLFFIVIWLGGDLVVFGLSLSLLDRKLPIAVRLDRAGLVEYLDRWVVYAYLVTLPLGVGLAWARGWWPIVAVPWLLAKVTVIGVLLLLAVKLIAGATGASQLLQQIAAAEDQAETLEAELRQRIRGLAPYAPRLVGGFLRDRTEVAIR
jgi:hypothetical protein